MHDTKIARIKINICSIILKYSKKDGLRAKISEIASRIREIRKLRNMTIQELAYRCDMERSNMSRIEKGKTNITIKTLCKICTALGAELKDIVR